MRTTQNLSLRLDPEVDRLARRTAESLKMTLREFYEAAVRYYVTACTTPEERTNLLSSVEAAFLNRLDGRIKDMLERVAALSAKEAMDQAHTLQMMKRVLFGQVKDRNEYKKIAESAWAEAVAKVQKRGRPVPPDVLVELQSKLDEREERLEAKDGEVRQAWDEAKQALEAKRSANQEIITLKNALARVSRELQSLEGALQWQQRERKELELELRRERWVSERLEKQGMNPIGRKTAAELRAQFDQEQVVGRVSS